jgi:hypothetical protein
MTPISTPKHPFATPTPHQRFDLRHLALCLPLFVVGLSPVACDVEPADSDAADDEYESEDEGSGVETTEDGGSGDGASEDDGSAAEDPESEEPCEAMECAPERDPSFDLTAEPDPSAGTACGGPTYHMHGWNLFPASYETVLGCDCAPGQNRDYFSSYNVGNGSCSPIGWLSPDPRDCRVRMQINRSGGYANGTCYAVVEQSAAGSCYSAQTNTGCNDPGITNCVCNHDSYCCNNQWDALCAWEVTSLGCG